MTNTAMTASDQFRWLWCSINGDASWSANPLVWAISFRRINPPIQQGV